MFSGREALSLRVALCAAVLLVSMGAKHRSTNFIVETADPALAAQIAEAAERLRGEMAMLWLGQRLGNWSQPCPMTVQVGPNLGAGGATSFTFDRGEVFGWRMSIQGPKERIFDCVLPHEITHMIFATWFREPLPRWADEGGATSVENPAELMKHRKMLAEFLTTNRGIAFNKMFAMREYPRDVMPLYAQGYSTADFLIQNGGRRRYVNFIADGLKSNDWPGAVKRNYGWKDLGTLQGSWLAWVRQGSPALQTPSEPAPGMLAAASPYSPGLLSGVVPAVNLEPAGKPASSGKVVPVGSATPVKQPEPDPGFVPVGSAVPEQLAAAPRRERPTPNLIYHEVAPAASSLASSPAPTAGPRKLIPVGPPENEVAASTYSLPPLVAPAQPERLATTPWRAPTLSIPAPPADTSSDTQTARPQPYERPRQTILEWSRD